MRVLVLMAEHFAEPVSNVLRSALPDYEIRTLSVTESRDTIGAELETADFLVWSGAEISGSLLKRAHSLRLIQKWGAGVDGIDVSRAMQLSIPVANVPGGNATSVAEHFFALLLSLSKLICDANYSIHQGAWPQAQLTRAGPIELDGKTLGILGLGHIGREVAMRAKAFGMRMLYHKPVRLTLDEEVEMSVSYAERPELLREADIVGIAVPLTKSTRGMFTIALMRQMKSSAMLINISRGAVVSEPDLHYALTHGLVAGAGLDVLCDEPPPPSHPLLQLPNVVLTPHIAGRSREAITRMSEVCADNICRVSAGLRPEHEVRVD